jgi:hypothetical protein
MSLEKHRKARLYSLSGRMRAGLGFPFPKGLASMDTRKSNKGQLAMFCTFPSFNLIPLVLEPGVEMARPYQ